MGGSLGPTRGSLTQLVIVHCIPRYRSPSVQNCNWKSSSINKAVWAYFVKQREKLREHCFAFRMTNGRTKWKSGESGGNRFTTRNLFTAPFYKVGPIVLIRKEDCHNVYRISVSETPHRELQFFYTVVLRFLNKLF